MSDRKFFAVLLTAFVVIIAVIIAVVFAIERHVCGELESNTGHQTKYDFPSGCYIQIDNQWVPSSTWVENTGN